MSNELIYIADDEERIRDLISSYLVNAGYEVKTFSDGRSVLEEFQRVPADMLILDIMMPGLDGYGVTREVRKTSPVPVIMVSAKDEEIDRILGLELGSDDYMSKPFSPRELVVRVKNIFRRMAPAELVSGKPGSEKLLIRDLAIQADERLVTCHGVPLDFTTKEFEFLLFMVKNKNHAFTREQLVEKIWGYDYLGETRTIDDLVKRIRKKLSEANSLTEITTVWGYGYKIGD